MDAAVNEMTGAVVPSVAPSVVPLILRRRNGDLVEGSLQMKTAAQVELELSGTGNYDCAIKAPDWFTALQRLREKLQRRKCKVCCQGARADVIATAMCRSTGSRRAYVVQLTEPVSQAHQVDIFDYAEPANVVTVKEQKAFHKAWFASVGIS